MSVDELYHNATILVSSKVHVIGQGSQKYSKDGTNSAEKTDYLNLNLHLKEAAQCAKSTVSGGGWPGPMERQHHHVSQGTFG